MDIISSEINLEAARLFFSPALIGAMTATWLLLVTGTAGRVVLLVEELTQVRRGPSVSAPQANPSGDATRGECHEVEWRSTPCVRAENAAPQRVKRHQPEAATTQADILGAPRDHSRPVPIISRDRRHHLALRPVRPSGGRPRHETGPMRKHSRERRSPDDEDVVLVTPHPRLRHRPSPARIAHHTRFGRLAPRDA